MIYSIRTLVFIDQAVKLLSITMLQKPISILTGFLALELQQNPGISFGILSNLDKSYKAYITLAMFGIVAMIGIYYFIRKNQLSRLQKVGMELILAGGIGNLIDRLMYGSIIDMIEIYFFGIHIFTCNIADVYLSLGAMIYALYSNRKIQNAEADKYATKYKLFKEDGL